MIRSSRTFLLALAVLAVGGAAAISNAGPPTPARPAPKVKDTAAAARSRVYFIEGDSLLDPEARESVRRSYDEARKLQDQTLENVRKLEELIIAAPPPPGEMILPDTVYTTEVTIGPEGIEYYDSAGVRQVIHGRPVRPDMPFVFSEEGGRLITRKHASDIVQMGVDVHIAADERVEGNVVVISGNIQVEGEVKGDVVAVLGDVTIDGYVHGSAVAPFGKVQVNPGGVVRKDVAASAVDKLPGSLVGGRTNYTGVRLPSGVNVLRGFAFALLLFHIGLAVFVVFLILLGHVFAAKNIAAIRARISTNGIKSFIIGLLAEFLGLPVLFVLLLITVIGIPVALLVLPVAVAVAMILGLAGFGLMLGEKLADNTGFHLPTQLGRTVAGAGAVLLLVVFGALLVLTFRTPISVIGWTIFGIGHAVIFIAVTTGLGAVVLTRFGTRPKQAPAAAVAPVPAPANPSSPPPGEFFATPTL